MSALTVVNAAVATLNFLFVVGWSVYVFWSVRKDKDRERQHALYSSVAVSFAVSELNRFFDRWRGGLGVSGDLAPEAVRDRWSEFSTAVARISCSLRAVVEPFDAVRAANVASEFRDLQDDVSHCYGEFDEESPVAASEVLLTMSNHHARLLGLIVSYVAAQALPARRFPNVRGLDGRASKATGA